MIEIGRTKIRAVRVKGADGKLRANGDTKVVQDEVWRQCREELGGHYGPDRRRKLVVGLVGVDQLVLYPKGTRQEVRVNLRDVYAWALRSRALRTQLEKARERKEKLKASRERRRIEAADRRMRDQVKKERAL